MSGTPRKISPNQKDARVGAALRARREAKGVTRKAFAASLGISDRKLATIETGTATMSADELYRATRLLGTSPSALIAGIATNDALDEGIGSPKLGDLISRISRLARRKGVDPELADAVRALVLHVSARRRSSQ